MSSVDVFVPCYRYGHFLHDCVNSVLGQPIPKLRVLIIDDASPDDSAEVARELMAQDSRVEFIQHDCNRGHIATYNEGIEWTSADYMLLLSADDVLMPGALWRAAKLMDAHPEVSMTFGRIIYFPTNYPVSRVIGRDVPLRKSLHHHKTAVIADPECDLAGDRRADRFDSPPSQPDYEILDGAAFLRLNRNSNQVHTATAVVRTELQKQIGGYRKELPHAGDMEMWFRFAAHAAIGFVNDYQAAARIHEANMQKKYYKNQIDDLQQRKLAIDVIFGNYGDRFQDAAGLKNEMHQGLAEAAVRAAGGPFNIGDIDGCDRILDLAVEVFPNIEKSLLWRVFALRRHLGPRIWAMLRSGIRPIATRLLRLEN
jgi:glycosyltransferase involved in cell wall biosynthesis